MRRPTHFRVLPLLAFLGLAWVVACGGGGDSTPSAPVTPPPAITLFQPVSGIPGTSVVLTGTHLTGAVAVTFGGVTAPTFTVDGDVQITAVVPPLAVTGPIAVSTAGGTATSAGPFTVLAPIPAPSLTHFNPTSAAVGSLVTLSGSHLSNASAVTFGGVATMSFSVDSDAQITAAVPPLAITGPISVTTPGGTAVSSGVFTVLTPVPPPTLTQFTPVSGVVGTKITLSGTHLTGASSVTFGGVSAPSFLVDSDTQITAEVPALAVTGPIAVTTAGGTAISVGSFTVVVLGQGPSITRFDPTHGPVGAKIILAGTNFTATAAVSFHGTVAPSITYVGPSELDVLVPSGATTGPISVTTADGTAVSASDFTVENTATTLDLFLDGCAITQGSQTYAGTVPLVANRDGYLRLFVRCNESNTARPSVRASIQQGEVQVWQAVIEAPGSSTPTQIVEGELAASWNILVPGSNLQPGSSLMVDIDPSGLIPEADESNNRLVRSLDIQAAPVFPVTVIPILQAGLTGNVDSGRTLGSWTDRFQRMYPIQNPPGGVDVVKGALYTTAQNLNTGGLDAWVNLLDELEAKHYAEASSRYYYGALNVTGGMGLNGLSYMEGTVALGWDKTGLEEGNNYPDIFAHELGHLFGRQHAPCNVMDPDPHWPSDPAYAKALIGVYGFDLATMQLMDRAVCKDLMSYCAPIWISDYTYRGVQAYRSAHPLPSATPGAASAKQECLLVSGRLREGRMVLDPAMKVFTVPRPPSTGPFSLELQDREGRTLEAVSFGLHALADPPESGLGHFVFTIPLKAETEAVLHGLRVMEKGTLRASRDTGLNQRARVPLATRQQPDMARVVWDPEPQAKVMIRDPRTGEVLAFAEGGRFEFPTDASALECTFTDGVRSQRLVMEVR